MRADASPTAQLINNSGTTWGAKYEDFPEAQGWDRVIATNVKAIFYRAFFLRARFRPRS